jgi:nucleoside diphosphate kinase
VYELKKGMKRINFDSLYRYGNLKLNLNDSLILAPYSGYDVEISDWAFHDSTLGNYAYPKEVEPLIIINGKKFKQLSFDDIKSKIISVNVLKGEEAIKVYGKDGKRGVVVVEVEEPVIIIESEGKQSLRVIKTFTNPTQEELEAFGEEVREQGYSFKIDRFKTRRGKLVKLKINFAGTDHTIATNTGIKKINFTFYKDGRDPEMTTVSY